MSAANLAAGVAGANDGSAGAARLDPRLKPAAHEFEASLMKELLEPLQHDPLFDGGGDENGADSSGGALMSFGAEALAKAISDRGGFGIAEKILEHIGLLQTGAAGNGKVPEKEAEIGSHAFTAFADREK